MAFQFCECGRICHQRKDQYVVRSQPQASRCPELDSARDCRWWGGAVGPAGPAAGESYTVPSRLFTDISLLKPRRARGALQSEFVLRSFGTHLAATNGSIYLYGAPVGALALAATAVCAPEWSSSCYVR